MKAAGPREAAFKAAIEAGMTEAEALTFSKDYPADEGDTQRLNAHAILCRILDHAEAHLRGQ